MNKFDDVYNSLVNKNYNLEESVLDIPRNSLDPTVFEFPDEGMPILRPAIKVQILDTLQALDRMVQVNNAYIIGSILTKQYSAASDIDVNIEVDPMIDDPLTKQNVYYFVRNNNGDLATGTTHPINYFIVEGEYDIDKTQAAYDVANEKWIKEPEDLDVQVVAYLDKFQDAIGHIDLTIQGLRRNIIDYDELISLDKSQIEQLGSLLKNKLEDIERDMQFLISAKQQSVEQRRAAFARDMTPEEIKKYGKKYKLPENIIYKMLEKYYYLDFIRNIKNILGDDGELDAGDISKIKQLGKKQWEVKESTLKEKYKDPLNRHHMKGVRGITRKSQSWIPQVHKKIKGDAFAHHELGFAKKTVQVAKNADQGIWHISKQEAIDIAEFYSLRMPSAQKKAKQLGKTKIILWRKKPNEYYLVKPKKRD